MRIHKRPMLAALLASSALVAPAYAQTADQDATEVGEIVVTGIRASQAKSIDIKRNETALVDAISAEDIGKLPDVTVADALQRVAGIQIQRNAGEGATANIRGLPQVVTLLNGEQYLAAGNLGGAQPSLNDVPSQLMSSLVVFKSQDVRNALSGISGTIDLRTRRLQTRRHCLYRRRIPDRRPHGRERLPVQRPAELARRPFRRASLRRCQQFEPGQQLFGRFGRPVRQQRLGW